MLPRPEFPKPAALLEPVRVLLLEDDRISLEIVTAYLRRIAPADSAIHSAGTLSEALELLARAEVDLIIADLHLPDSAGAGTIESLVRVVGCPVIAITSDHDAGLRDATLACGAYDFLHKGDLTEPTLARLVRLAAVQARTFRSLRESEGRLRAIMNHEPECVKLLDGEGRLLEMNPAGLRMIEADSLEPLRGHCVYGLVVEEHRAAFRALTQRVARGEEGMLEFEIVGLKGGRRWLETRAVPLRDGYSAEQLVLGITRDVTERRRTEAALRLEHETARTLAVAASAPEGVRAVLRAICETEGWKCGRFFRLDEAAGVLRYDEAASYHAAEFEALSERSRGLTFERGAGLAGAVWQSGSALWVSDTSRDPRVQQVLAHEPRLRSAFVFPVLAQGAVAGVVTMWNDRIREPDRRLQDTIELVGSLLGQFLRSKEAEAGLRQSEALFRQSFELAGTGVAHVSLDGIFLRVNRRLCQILGYSEAELVGREVKQLSHPEDRDAADPSRRELHAGRRESVQMEKRYLRIDGSTVWIDLTIALARDAQATPLYEISILEDITQRKAAEEELRKAERRQAVHLRYQERIARFGQTALAQRDRAELIEKAVQAVLEALGAEAVAYLESEPGVDEVFLRSVVGVAGAAGPGTVDCAAGSPLREALLSGTRVLADGARLPFAWSRELRSMALLPVRGGDGVRGALCAGYRPANAFAAEQLNFAEAAASVLSTALLRIESESRVAYLAQFDALTGLPNRTLLADRFSQTILHAKRREVPLAVLFIDLDGFKTVNDTLGHAGGDELLKEVAVRLQSTVRGGDTVARISGDEFAIVLADLTRLDDAALVAQKVIDRLAAAVNIGGKEVFVTASVGIAVFPGDGEDAETLIGAADAAMYRAKQSGRNAFQFFTAEINQRSRARAQMGADLWRALERDELMLVYQPKVDLATRRTTGAEALLRWKHPERGLVPPVEFIPVMEETGLIVPVGDWVLRRACQDLKAWQAAGHAVVPVAVNLSARQFRRADLDSHIKALVSEGGVDPGLIELEITESQLMHDPDHAIRMMRALRDAGMRIAIDDFGTGYSSLAYLNRFPVSALKIDRSFVKDLSRKTGDATLVRTIIEMAHSLGFIVVAEGVETEEQAVFLRLLRCEQAQGYLFAKPMPAVELVRLLAQR